MTKYMPPPKKGKLTAEFTKAVTDYLLVETEIAPADIIMVFGNDARESLADRAAILYKQGLGRKIVVSGGVKGKNGIREADDIADKLVKKGVPEKDIIRERRATNTGENVLFSKPLIDQKIGLHNVHSILAVGSIIASRRFLMTLERHWPEPHKMMAPANPFRAPTDKWYTLKLFRQKVLKEYDKIPKYLKCGFIAEVDIDQINQKTRRKRHHRR